MTKERSGLPQTILWLFAMIVAVVWIDPATPGVFAKAYPAHYIRSYYYFLLTTPLLYWGILRTRKWAVSMSALLLVSMMVGALVFLSVGGPLHVSVLVQFTAVAIFVILLLTGAIPIEGREVRLLSGTLVCVAAIVYIVGCYFPRGVLEYSTPVPTWIFIWDRSFLWREELVLTAWGVYWILRMVSGIIRRLRAVTGSQSPAVEGSH